MPGRSKRDSKGKKDSPQADRRSNLALRDVLNDLIEHVRAITNSCNEMPPAEIEYAQRRLEWLADEVWRLAVEPETDNWR